MRLRISPLFILPILLLLGNTVTRGQTASATDYFQQARRVAFDAKKFSAARRFCDTALQLDPLFTDARIFTGRLYAWDHLYDSARLILHSVITSEPANLDALLALSDVAYWGHQYPEVLDYCSRATAIAPHSTDILLRKARTFFAMKLYDSAKNTCDNILKLDAGNADAKSLSGQLINYSLHNKIGAGYDYYYFNKQFPQPWHIGYLEYSRLATAGTFTGRIKYGSRFGLQGWQGELEAYPKISRKWYSYVNAGYSPNNNYVFPRFHSAVSLFAVLPKAWELEGGVRFLQFDAPAWIYTASAGKYTGHYWFNAKAFVTPGSGRTLTSYFLTSRYYYSNTDSYASIGIGSGISPDENRNVLINTASNLHTYRVIAQLHHRFIKTVLIANLAWSKDEYLSKTYGDQLNAGIGFQRIF